MGAIHKTKEHRDTKAQWAPVVAAGNAYCTEPICLHPTRWIAPHTAWDLAHDRTTGGYRGPAHRRCNRSEGATYGNRLRGQRRHGTATVTPRRTRAW